MTNYVSVDVGGTKILASVVTDNGKIVARHKVKTDRRSKKRLIEQAQSAVEAALVEAKLEKSDVSGMAFGVPGVVDGERGHIVFTPNVPLSETPFGEIMRDYFACRVVVGNDVNLGVLGEQWRGAAKKARSAFGIFVGTGIGGGLILDGKLVEGFRGLGGEVGHLLVPLGADQLAGMPNKKQTFLEDLCSRTAIENQLRHAIEKENRKSVLTEIIGDKKMDRIRSGALKEALRRKDPLVTDVIRRASYLLGLATASVLHVVDPEVIIFGGGVIEACGDWMLPQIEKAAGKVAMRGTGKPLQIVRSQLGDDAIILGGVALLKSDTRVLAAPLQTAPPLEKPPRRRQAAAQVDKPLPAK